MVSLGVGLTGKSGEPLIPNLPYWTNSCYVSAAGRYDLPRSITSQLSVVNLDDHEFVPVPVDVSHIHTAKTRTQTGTNSIYGSNVAT